MQIATANGILYLRLDFADDDRIKLAVTKLLEEVSTNDEAKQLFHEAYVALQIHAQTERRIQ